jgi:hypothetical protein
MNTNIKRVLFWSPRVLCILVAMFLSLLALDVFDEGYGFGETIVALLIHLIPTYIILFSLAVAWRWEWVGAILFITLALLNIVSSEGGGWVLSGLLFLLVFLFLLNWIYRSQLKI